MSLQKARDLSKGISLRRLESSLSLYQLDIGIPFLGCRE